MKKAYISPLAEVVKTEMEQMICESNELKLFEDDFTPDLTITDNDDTFTNVFEGLW